MNAELRCSNCLWPVLTFEYGDGEYCSQRCQDESERFYGVDEVVYPPPTEVQS